MTAIDDNQALTLPEQAKALYRTPEHLGTGIGMLLDREVALDPYRGAGRCPFTPEQQKILGALLTDQQIHVRPDDGNLYLPGVYYRRRLNEAFGMGGWALVPVGEPGRDDSGRNPTVYYTGRLYVLNRFAAQAMGRGTFITNNAKSDYGTALESARTDCLTRCAKDWIATELWDPDFANGWRDQHCARVKNPDPARFGNAIMVWLKKDDPVFAPPTSMLAPSPPPNVPVLSTNRTTGQPIMGAWPKPMHDPSAEKMREMDDDFRRAVGGVPLSDLEVQLQKSIDANTIEVINKKTGEVTRETKATSGQVAKIHILCRELKLPDDYYRNGLKTYYGVDSSAVLTKAQAEDAILRLERTKSRVPAEMLAIVRDTDDV